MNQSMISAAVTMGQLQQKLDTISNNMANSNTNGYKRRDATVFRSVFFSRSKANQLHDEEVGRATPNGIRLGTRRTGSSTAVSLNRRGSAANGPYAGCSAESAGHVFSNSNWRWYTVHEKWCVLFITICQQSKFHGARNI